MLAHFVAPCVLLLAAGCAAAVPGYSPPSQKSARFKATVHEGGTLTGEGAYRLSEHEKTLDCKHLAGSMHIIIDRLRDAQDRGGPSPLASTTQSVAAPLHGGSTTAADRQGELARQRARLYAYNDRLAEKGCKTIDIEAELAKPPAHGNKY
jgi:hypothetical protein